MTLITAPPGYGKTTLATQFARQSAYPVAWHTIGERERDLPVLMARNLMALETIAPGIQESAPAANAPSRDLAAFVADYLHSSLADEAIYVLDDVHHLFGALAAEEWLRSLVTLMPANCHVVLISRTTPDLPLWELIARRKLLSLGPEDLRFSSEEVRQLAVAMLGQEPSAERVRELEAHLEGWPAGTVLAFGPLLSALEPVTLRGKPNPEALFNPLAQAMLVKQPADIREFLLVSSTLRLFNPEHCQAVLALQNSDDLFGEIQSRNLFVTRVRGGLAYHRLFRDFLQDQLKQAAPARFTALHRQAAQYFETQDEPDEAFDHYLAAGNPDRAAAIADDRASAYYRAGRVETLLDWLARLEGTGQRPCQLIYICALVQMARYNFTLAEAHLDEIEAIYQVHGAAAELSEVDLQRASMELLRGQYAEALNRSTRLLNANPTAVVVRMRALNAQGYAQLYLGQVKAAVDSLRDALALHRMHSDAFGTSQVLQTLALACFRMGRLAEAITFLQEAVDTQRSLGGTRNLAYALNNLGFYYHRASQYEQALVMFTEAMDILARFPDQRTESYLLWSLGSIRRDLGSLDEALKLYRRAAERLGTGEPGARCSMLVGLSMLKRWQERWPEAETLAQEAVCLAEAHSLAAEGFLAQANVWICRAHLGQAQQARERLIGIVHELHGLNAHYEQLQALGLTALADLLDSDPPTARRHFREALHLAEEIGTAQALAVEAVRWPVLEALLAEHPVLSRDLAQLRAARDSETHRARPTVVSDRLPFTLRVLSLGQEMLIRDGKVIPTSDWRAIKARELFFYLLVVGPARREAICAEFWPDSTTEQVRSNFHTTLYHARQALGADTLSFEDGLYRINQTVAVWYDAFQLEHLVMQAGLLAPRDPRAEDLWRKATELYLGDFLPGLDTNWITAHREKLRDGYLAALVGLGKCVHNRRDGAAALDIFKRASAVDPYREDIHRAILSCYAEQGERQKVRAHLRELERLLRADLDAEPSAETLALASALLK